MKRSFSIFIFLLVSVFVFGQSFTLTSDAKKIVQGSSFTIKYTLDGAKGNNFSVSNFGTLEIIGGPNQSTSMSIINGAMTQSQSFSYTIYATKIGRYIIPSASIMVNGKKMASNSLKIEVVKGQSANQIAEKDKESFVRLETTAEEAILGQQITLEYKLYTQQNVNDVGLVNEPDYDGFFSQELRNYRAEVSREILEGKEYYTKVLKKIALFPQRTGTFDFSPVTINLAIPIPGARRTGGFFSSVPTRNLRIQTNPLTLLVKDPPANAPVSFSGAVGKYAIATTINKNKITTDDAFVVNMEVRGTGDGKTFSAPLQPESKNLEYYDPNVVRDEDTSRDGIVSNYKQIEYLIVPKKPGAYTIRPEFTYYDTDSNDYVTLYSRAYRVKVTQGNRKITTDDRDVSIAQDLMPNRTSENSTSSFMLQMFDPFWIGSMVLGLFSLCFIGYKKHKLDAENDLDPEEKKRRKATQLANNKLEKAKSFKEEGNNRKFYEEISSTMNGYLGNKYGLPNSQFQKDKIIAKLKENNVEDESIDKYLSILKVCEMALFAGQPNSKMDEILSSCTQLILSLEQ